ncbi:hypothetical protein [Nonomuraea sp. NPDC049695]|uniref:hypothetical protein n=1 Tax=Nonomuraea sp. NPDC049695 TaxID=3154734 RepID=UPI00342D249F
MKQQGFKYVAWVMPEKEETDEERNRASGEYRAMRKYREKYGFGAFAMSVYPQEMTRQAGVAELDANPNAKLMLALSNAQALAYIKARNTCEGTAAKQVLGLNVRSGADLLSQLLAARKEAMTTELDSDPKLVELATAMATCLKGKGYAVSDAKPTAVADRGATFAGEYAKLRNGSQPLTDQQARQHLDREIKAALDDLECGKDFYPEFEPRKREITRQVAQKFGRSDI